VHLKLAEASLA